MEIGCEGVVVDFASGQDGNLRVQELHELSEDPALGLPSQAQKDEVVPGQDGVHQLRDHGVVVADDAGKEPLSGPKFLRPGSSGVRPSPGGTDSRRP